MTSAHDDLSTCLLINPLNYSIEKNGPALKYQQPCPHQGVNFNWWNLSLRTITNNAALV